MAVAAADIRAAVMAQRDKAHLLFDRLAACSSGGAGITRTTYGEGENQAHRLVRAFAAELGLETRQDHAANSYMTLPGRDRAKPAVLIGSHLDSVPNGGNFDGAAGVVAGLLGIAALQALGITPERDITVMAVRAEESVWFQVSYIGSRGALGTLPDGAMEARRIDSGRTLAEHLAECGGDPQALRAGPPFLDPARIHAFLEVHIEQAPSLLEAGCPVGLCTGIPGNFRFPNAQVSGRHDHVGTPRRFRRDAMMAAAELAGAMDAVWQETEAAGDPMAITFGRFHTDPDMHGMTTVPGAFHFSLDVRAYDARVLAAVEARFREIIAGIEQRRGVSFALGKRAHAEVGEVSRPIYQALADGAAELAIPVLPLGSPASHDAAAFAAAGVPIGMLFVRNEHGSHNPDEAMDVADLLAATSILTWWLAREA
jgi:N-carbamoyl-L-amino-acid hydrolase